MRTLNEAQVNLNKGRMSVSCKQTDLRISLQRSQCKEVDLRNGSARIIIRLNGSPAKSLLIFEALVQTIEN